MNQNGIVMNDRQGKLVKSFSEEIRLILGYARQVWHLIPRQHKLALGGAALLMAMVSTCNTVFPLLVGQLLDGVKAGADQGLGAPDLYRIAALYLGLIGGVLLLREIIQVVRRYLVENTCTRIEKTMTVTVYAHLLKADLAALTQEKIGALQGRISRSVVGFVRFIRLAFLDSFPPLLTGIFALTAAVSKQPLLALAMAGVIPISLFLTLRQLSSQKGIRLTLIRSREEMDGTVVEQLSGLDYVRAANMHDYEVRRVDDAAERRRALENYHHFKMSLFGFVKAVNEGTFHILVLGLAAYLAINGTTSYGDVLTFSFLFGNVMAPLNEVHRGLDEGHECSLMVADLLTMLHEPADPSFAPQQVQDPQAVLGQPILVVEDLVVDFPTEKGGRRVLGGVSLVVHHGETIGLAGPSGCGKTTWLRVLLRLTHPSAGRVHLGGVPLEAVSREAIGRLVGYVGQSPFVFAGTVEENIRYGNSEANLEAVQEAARRACIHEEILEMPGGYQAGIKERGLNLSAGQRQRLALARVFLKDPPLLILDEGTSALDTISERNIQRAIDLARKDKTVILVAHRLSTLLDADRIYVFQGGHVVETGTYAELYRRGGAFTELVNCAEVGVTANGVANGVAVQRTCAAGLLKSVEHQG
jgi:ATP-binding cassette subfamily B protein